MTWFWGLSREGFFRFVLVFEALRVAEKYINMEHLAQSLFIKMPLGLQQEQPTHLDNRNQGFMTLNLEGQYLKLKSPLGVIQLHEKIRRPYWNQSLKLSTVCKACRSPWHHCGGNKMTGAFSYCVKSKPF